MKHIIKQRLLEFRQLGEADTSEPIENDEKPTKSEYDRVQRILDNDIWNHAEVAKRLMGSKSATQRSLFRKKLHKMKNDGGGTYEFDKDEIAKIMSILTNVAKDINKPTNDADSISK